MPDISYYYCIPYFAMFLGAFAIWIIGEFCTVRTRHLIANIILPLAFLMFWGFRGFEATDWKVYYPLFTEAWSSNILEEEHIEVGFRAIIMLLRAVSSSYWFYQAVLTAANILLLRSIFRRYSRYPGLSWVIWIACFPIMHDLQRNVLAVLVCVWAFRYIERRELGKYLLCVCVAFLFHHSTLMFLPLYFVVKRNFSTGLYVWLLVFCVVDIFVKIPILSIVSNFVAVLNRNPDVYLNGDYAESVFRVGKHIFTVLPLVIIGILQLRESRGLRSRVIISYNLFMLYLICYCVLHGNGEIQRRLVMIFEWSACLAIPWALSWRKDCLYKTVFIIYVLFFCTRHCMSHNNVMWRYENNLLMETTGFDERADEIDEVDKYLSTQGGN